MDYTKRIFEYFAVDETRRKLVIAPQAPPVERADGTVHVAMDLVLDDKDTTDTLIGMLNFGSDNTLRGARERMPDHSSESFCLGIPGIGRFRVTYLTQRSSKAITIVRIPFAIPTCAALELDPALIERLTGHLRNPAGGMLGVCGPSVEANSTFVYALLQQVNASDRRIILIQERELSYLMRHDNSIVVQRELHTDCTGMDEGIHDGLNLGPDILYIGDLLVTDRLPSLVRAVETGIQVVVSMAAMDRESFMLGFRKVFGDVSEMLERRMHEIIQVAPGAPCGLTASCGGVEPAIGLEPITC